MENWSFDFWKLNYNKNLEKLNRLKKRHEIHYMIFHDFCIHITRLMDDLENDISKKIKLDSLSKLDEDLKYIKVNHPNNISFVLKKETVYNYEMVFEGEKMKLDSVKDLKGEWWVFEIFYNSLYRGHVFGSFNKNYPNKLLLIDIRSSIINTLTKPFLKNDEKEGRVDISKKLLQEIINFWGKEVQIFLDNPAPGMQYIASKEFGFKHGPNKEFDNYDHDVIGSEGDYMFNPKK